MKPFKLEFARVHSSLRDRHPADDARNASLPKFAYSKIIVWVSEESSEVLVILQHQYISHDWILVIILLSKVLSLHDFEVAFVL